MSEDVCTDDVCLSDFAARKCEELEVVHLLLRQIQSECIRQDLKIHAVVALGHCVDASGEYTSVSEVFTKNLQFPSRCLSSVSESPVLCSFCAEGNRKKLVEVGGVSVLVRTLGSTADNEELNQAIKFVLQMSTADGPV